MEKYVVIMAGGVGSRFWPRSRKEKPKQLLNIFGTSSMIRETFERVRAFVPSENIFVITNELQAGLISEQLSELSKENIIAEPMGKNTAPCIAVAAKIISIKSADAVMITLPADHLIENKVEFEKLVDKGSDYAYNNKGLVTFGITPSRPETGYGYINFDKSTDEDGIYRVKEFVEKPDLKKAEEYLSNGNYLWNSGMFIWRVDVILDEMKKCVPNVFKLVEKIETDDNLKIKLNEIYPNFEKISIDYGVMEKSDNVYVIEGNFGWSDVGSWESVHELSNKDENGNSKIGEVFSLDTNNSYIFSEDKFTAVVGMENVVVINMSDSLLVCKKNNAQKVKKIVEFLEENNREELL